MAGLDDLGPMRDFVERNDLDGFPHAYDPDGAIWQRFGTITRSAFVFVNDDGTVERTDFGVFGADALNAKIDELLAS